MTRIWQHVKEKTDRDKAAPSKQKKNTPEQKKVTLPRFVTSLIYYLKNYIANIVFF